jgi:hypothetical protein
MGAEPRLTIEQEIQQRHDTAMQTLACRCLGEPYNFHRIASMLSPGMMQGDSAWSAIIRECLSQYTAKDSYTPQSIALACRIANSQAIEYAKKDSEMSLPDAMEAYTLYHGQWAEVRISELTKGYVLRGMTTEEIQVEQAKARREFGLTGRLNTSDGRDEFEAELLAALEGKQFTFPVTPCLSGMEKFVNFYEPGDYIVIAALSRIGKSYYALNQVYHNAVRGVPSCVINLEMTPKHVQKRIWQMHADIKFSRDMRGPDTQTMNALKAWDEVKKMPFRSYNPGPTLPAVLSTIRQDYHERGIQFAVVDYAQLMNIPGYRGGRNYELGEISAAFRALALELQIPIMVLAQLKQEVEQRGDKKGGLFDIKDCANFSQDATMVQVLYRPDVYDIATDANGIPYPEGYAEVFIAKGREVGHGLVEARFNPVKGFNNPEQWPQTQFPIKETFTPQRPSATDDIPF